MTAGSLTPTLALAYLRELSPDVRAALVLDADGAPLAGEERLAERAREALSGTAPERARIVRSGSETLLVARSSRGGAIAVVTGSDALLALIEHDLVTVLGELAEA
ncbi:MAG: hypothetical protein WBC33_05420 [Conexibacter sp.]